MTLLTEAIAYAESGDDTDNERDETREFAAAVPRIGGPTFSFATASKEIFVDRLAYAPLKRGWKEFDHAANQPQQMNKEAEQQIKRYVRDIASCFFYFAAAMLSFCGFFLAKQFNAIIFMPALLVLGFGFAGLVVIKFRRVNLMHRKMP